MAGFGDPAFYGDRWADVYDEHHGWLDPAAAVEFLAGLAGDGRALELAIGTGRVALPLAGRGIAVEGVDASEAMVARLRAKPGGDSLPVVIGDMAEVPVSGPFRLVYLIFNTLFGLLERSPQPGRLSTSPAAMARTSWAWSRSFWSAYRRANRPIAAVNFGPFPM